MAGSEPVPLARSLALSGASQPNGPVITYVSSNSFDASQLMNVSGQWRREKGRAMKLRQLVLEMRAAAVHMRLAHPSPTAWRLIAATLLPACRSQ